MARSDNVELVPAAAAKEVPDDCWSGFSNQLWMCFNYSTARVAALKPRRKSNQIAPETDRSSSWHDQNDNNNDNNNHNSAKTVENGFVITSAEQRGDKGSSLATRSRPSSSFSQFTKNSDDDVIIGGHDDNSISETKSNRDDETGKTGETGKTSETGEDVHNAAGNNSPDTEDIGTADDLHSGSDFDVVDQLEEEQSTDRIHSEAHEVNELVLSEERPLSPSASPTATSLPRSSSSPPPPTYDQV